MVVLASAVAPSNRDAKKWIITKLPSEIQMFEPTQDSSSSSSSFSF